MQYPPELTSKEARKAWRRKQRKAQKNTAPDDSKVDPQPRKDAPLWMTEEEMKAAGLPDLTTLEEFKDHLGAGLGDTLQLQRSEQGRILRVVNRDNWLTAVIFPVGLVLLFHKGRPYGARRYNAVAVQNLIETVFDQARVVDPALTWTNHSPFPLTPETKARALWKACLHISGDPEAHWRKPGWIQ